MGASGTIQRPLFFNFPRWNLISVPVQRPKYVSEILESATPESGLQLIQFSG